MVAAVFPVVMKVVFQVGKTEDFLAPGERVVLAVAAVVATRN